MSRAPLWRLPEEALHFDETAAAWKVMAARGLGESRAIFIPLLKQEGDWKVAIEPQARLPFTRVMNGEWTTLLRRAGTRGCVYLCALRYDLPSNHPDDSVRLGPDGVPGEPPTADISGQELAEVLARFKERNAARIELDVVDGPADEEDPVEATPAQAAARARSIAPAPTDPAPAGTAPPLPEELTFAFGSCQYPAGMLDRRAAHASYRALAEHLRQPRVRRPERLLLLGDQVYTDATYGLLDPARLDERYRMPYEDLRDRDTGPFSALPLQFLSRVRTTPDDHEFVDNWEPWGRRVNSPRFEKGLEAFWEHQRRQPGTHTRGVYLEEQRPGWRLFMADTRTERSYRSAETLRRAFIMSGRQRHQLEGFLAGAAADVLKIVTSPAMLLPRSREYLDDPLYLDGWQGYPVSFHGLLGFLCDQQVRNVVFLSGDTHLACTARVAIRNPATGHSVDFVSHHAPALYAPYPFANETRHNLLLDDRFQFTIGSKSRARSYECTVHTELLDEGYNGCALMTASRKGSSWSTRVDVLRQEIRTPCSAAM